MNKFAPSGPSDCLGMVAVVIGWAIPNVGMRVWGTVKYRLVDGRAVNCWPKTAPTGPVTFWFLLYNCAVEELCAWFGDVQKFPRRGFERFIGSVTAASCCWSANAATAANWCCCCCCWAAAVAIVASVVRYWFDDIVSCWGDKLDTLDDIEADGDDQIREIISRLCLLTSFSFCESANLTTSGDEQPLNKNHWSGSRKDKREFS